MFIIKEGVILLDVTDRAHCIFDCLPIVSEEGKTLLSMYAVNHAKNLRQRLFINIGVLNPQEWQAIKAVREKWAIQKELFV